MKGSKYIAEMLKAYGVTHIFYQDMAMPILVKEAHKAGINTIICKSEEASGYMADGYARTARKPGIALGQSIGSANLAAGLHDAWLAGAPVIAISDKKSCMFQYRNSYQESDHKRLFDAVCRFNAFCDDPQEMPRILNQAFREVVTSKPRPAFIDSDGFFMNSPLDLADLPDEIRINKAFASYPALRPSAEEKYINEAAAAIDAAKKPLIIAGRGAVISGAAEELRSFASRGDIPIAITPDGKTIIDESDPLWAGVAGFYGMIATNEIIRESDLVIYIGSGISDHTTLNFTNPDPLAKVIQLDIDPVELGRSFYNTIPIFADAKVGIAQLVDAIAKNSRPEWMAFVSAKVKEHLAKMDQQASATDVLSPASVCYELTKTLPDNGIIVSDTGNSAIWTSNYIRMKPGQFYTRAAGSLGWGYPASLGVKCSAPERPVICFTGDGGFFYHSNEMETAVRCGINTVTILNKNGGLVQDGAFHEMMTGDEKTAEPYYRFADVDYCKLAESYGVWHKRVSAVNEINPAINEALAANRPAIIECVTSPKCHPLASR